MSKETLDGRLRRLEIRRVLQALLVFQYPAGHNEPELDGAGRVRFDYGAAVAALTGRTVPSDQADDYKTC